MRSFYSKYKLEIWLFLIALALRAAFFGVGYEHNSGDLIKTIKGDDGYYELSQSIRVGRGFTFDTVPPYKPNPLRPPVWPLLIAGISAFFNSYFAVLVFEIVLGSLIPILGMHVAKKIFPQKAIWFGTGVLLTLEPYGIFLSTVFYTETAFTFLFLLSCLFVAKYFEERNTRNLVWMTVFAALATLVKPTIEYVPVILAALIMWDARKAFSRKVCVHAGVVLVLFTLVISPWLFRNYREFGVLGMSAQPAYNLYMYLAPTVLSIDHHTNYKTELDAFALQPGFDENDITLRTSGYYSSKARDVILDHKKALLTSVATTLVTFFTHDGMLTFMQYAGKTVENKLDKPALTILLESPSRLFEIIGNYVRSGAISIVVVRVLWIINTLCLMVGAFLFLKREKKLPFALYALILIAYFALTTSINGLGVNARFRVPVNAFIFSFALYGFLVLWYGVRSRFLRMRNENV